MMRGDMMGSRNDMMNSRNDMMGSRNEMRDMMGGQRNNDMRDMMGSRNDMRDMMGSRDMMDRDNFRDVLGGRDSMMSQRSMSMSNGSYGGMNGGMGQNEHSSFSRSVSYSSSIAGSSSPPGPGGDGMKIGTWNEGRDNSQKPWHFDTCIRVFFAKWMILGYLSTNYSSFAILTTLAIELTL